MESPQNEDRLNKKFEYSIAIVGLSIAVILSTCDIMSRIEASNNLVDFYIFVPQIICGTFGVACAYFSIFIILYGSNLAKRDLFNDEWLHKCFSVGIQSMLFSMIAVAPILSLIVVVIVGVFTGVDLLELIKAHILIFLPLSIVFITILHALSVQDWLPPFKKMERLSLKKEITSSLVFALLLFLSVLFTAASGEFIYFFLEYPSLAINSDKLVYTPCDSMAVIQTTAIAFRTPNELNPLIVTVISPSGGEEQIHYTKVDRGRYISAYSLNRKPAGEYKIYAKTLDASPKKFFILLNESKCM